MRNAIIISMIIQIVLPLDLFAASKAVVVVPVHDDVSDNISDDLSQAFSRAFARQGIMVVSREKVESVMNYYRRSGRERSEKEAVSGAEAGIIRAKEHYYNFDHDEARALIKRSIGLLEAQAGDITNVGEALRDAYVVAAIIERSVKGRDNEARAYFKKALLLDPAYELEERAFPPSTIDVFDDVKRPMVRTAKGEITVDSDPKAAEVYVNGILRGVTPVKVKQLPEGRYKVAIKTNKYRSVEKEIDIVNDKPARMKESLQWVAGGEAGRKDAHEKLSSNEEAGEQIAEGGRIADLLRVPKVVLVDADESSDGGGTISLRMVDRRYKAGHNPVVVGYSANRKGLQDDLTQAAGILLDQMNKDIVKNPQKLLDPDGIGDPVLLGKRNRMLYTIPAFWAVVGGVIAATAGGAAAAAAMSGGGGGEAPATGSVAVQFK